MVVLKIILKIKEKKDIKDTLEMYEGLSVKNDCPPDRLVGEYSAC